MGSMNKPPQIINFSIKELFFLFVGLLVMSLSTVLHYAEEINSSHLSVLLLGPYSPDLAVPYLLFTILFISCGILVILIYHHRRKIIN